MQTITMKETATGVGFYDLDDNMVAIADADVHPDLHAAVFRYGLKQIMADAGAMSKGASTKDRIARIQRRADALRNGTWGLRPAAALPDQDLFDAVVKAGLLTDDDRTRNQWRNLGKRQRNALRGDARVIPHMPTSAAGDDVLAMFHVEQADEAIDAAADRAARTNDDGIIEDRAPRRRIRKAA